MSEDNKPIEVEAKAAGDEVKTEERATGEMPVVVPPEADAPKMPEAKASPTEAPAKAEAPAEPEKVEAKPEPKAEKAKAKKDEPARASRETVAMPVADLGAPPEIPSDVENPTQMPGPNDVPSGSPEDPAKAPGAVPSGDSRSLRRAAEFALIYRQGSAVITRFGRVGQRGQWRVVEYPTPSSASNAYAKQCSQFVGEGFSDYRD